VAQAEDFERERGRLTGIAARILDDRHEAEDVVQLAWIRWHESTATIENPSAWLTTVTTRLCLDRLRARIPMPADADADGTRAEPAPSSELGQDPEGSALQREAIGQALHVVVDRLAPNERVALVLHESFGFDFDTIGEVLGRTSSAARKLASRARAKTAGAETGGRLSDRQVVDAFMAAARGSDLVRLLALLAPGAIVSADAAAITAGTPARIEGREQVADFFDGSARAALPVLVDGRPGAAWFHRGRAMVAFDFTVDRGVVEAIVFRAQPEVLATVERRPDESDTPGSTSDEP
jgi:RNA polymerase sigma factor (sigma-70 family)